MPYQTLRLTGGANAVETPALNEAGISSSQLVRFKPDPKGAILVEKLGGWAKFYATRITSVVRAILGWEDTDANKWVAYGTSSNSASSLVAIQCFADGTGIVTASNDPNNKYDITPSYISVSAPVHFTAIKNSSQVTVYDYVATMNGNLSSVYIAEPISVGGLVLFGQYAVTGSGPSNPTYNITARDVLGNQAFASYTTLTLAITGGSVVLSTPSSVTFTFAVQASAPFPLGSNVNFTGSNPSTWDGSGIVTACTTTTVTAATYQPMTGAFVSGGILDNFGVSPILVPALNSFNITVILADHGYRVGDSFTVVTATSVGGVTLYGNYLVLSVINSYSFTIASTALPTSTAATYSGALIVTGGSSTTTAVTLNLGYSAFTSESMIITGGSSTTTHVTLNWASPVQNVPANGSAIYVSGIASPSAWNGSYVVTGASFTSVTYALSGSALSWGSGGSISVPLFGITRISSVGNLINVQGVSPAAWNGVFTVTSSTNNSVTYALSGSALPWVSAGSVSSVGGSVNLVYNTAIGIYTTGLQYGAVSYPIFGSNWSLDNWGEILIACPVGFTPISSPVGFGVPYGPLYSWDPISAKAKAAIIAAGPPASTGFFVAMPQRQIIAWGTTFSGIVDPLLIRWCDVSNYNVWIGQITNQAGSYRLSTGSSIIGAIQAQQQALIWTDIGLWSMQYIGPPFVYSFNQIAHGCGLIARRAMGLMNGVTYWMGRSQFYMLSGDGVQPIVCPIWDVVFQDIDLANLAKITTAVNSQFGEISWYYPVVGGNGENSAYVRYSIMTGSWDFGTLARTSWIDTSVLGPPIGYDPVSGYIVQHEISPDADGAPMTPSFTTGYFAVAEGDDKAFIDQVRPDLKWGYYNQTQNASVQITFNALDYAGGTPVIHGPYTVTKATTFFSTRIRARLVSMTVSSSDTGTWWRLGAIRYRVAPDGKF